jgi:ABC-type antimicrobial peptide transport system permease subunit
MRTMARRLVQLVVVVILATLFTFSLLRLFPGDVADAVIPTATQQAKEQFRKDNGLDKPFFEQYATWLGNILQGDFGKDYQTNVAVSTKLETAIPASRMACAAGFCPVEISESAMLTRSPIGGNSGTVRYAMYPAAACFTNFVMTSSSSSLSIWPWPMAIAAFGRSF